MTSATEQFISSPCALCGGADYVRAPFTTVTHKRSGAQAVFICKRCGMTPFFSTGGDEYAEFTSEQYYESGKYTVFLPALMRRVDECMARLDEAGQLKGKTLLDIGCGQGYLLEKAREKGAIVTGIEPNKSIVAELQAKGLRAVQGFGEHYPLGEQFDLITLFWVLDATKDPLAVLTRIRSLLKADGLILLQLGSTYNTPLFVQRPMESVVLRPNATDYHPFYFTRKSLKACLTKVGFDVIQEPSTYSTINYFVCKRAEPRELAEEDLERWRSLYAFFVLWRLRDWILVNGAAKWMYRQLRLDRFKATVMRRLAA